MVIKAQIPVSEMITNMLMGTTGGIVGDCMPDEERYAAEILVALLGAILIPQDVPGADDIHDFDLVLPDGKQIAVEVVSDTSEVDASFRAQISRINRMTIEGRHGWQIDLYTPGEHARDTRAATQTVKRLKDELPCLLKLLEDADPDPFENDHFYVARGQRHGEHPLAARLRELNVQSVSKKNHYVTDEGKPFVLFGQAGFSSSFGTSDIVEATTGALDKKRARITKAQQAGVDEVHLFVWLQIGQEHNDHFHGLEAAATFGFDDGDDSDLELGGADRVWVAGYGFNEAERLAYPVWSYSSGEGWCCHPVEDIPLGADTNVRAAQKAAKHPHC